MGPVDKARRSGRRAALVRVVGVEGNPPSREGQSLTVLEDGTVFGTLGCDGFDRQGAADAMRVIGSDTVLRNRYAWDERSHVMVEARALSRDAAGPEPDELLVVGAGPVARACVALGRTLGFRVRAAAPSEQGARELAPAETSVAPRPEDVAALDVGPRTYVVICGHDVEYSQPVLRALLPSPAPYLGMMGSRRHTGHLLAELRAAGFADEMLARVHSPVGLDLGATTPEEIALSALAQIVALRRGGSARQLG